MAIKSNYVRILFYNIQYAINVKMYVLFFLEGVNRVFALSNFRPLTVHVTDFLWYIVCIVTIVKHTEINYHTYCISDHNYHACYSKLRAPVVTRN